MPEGLFGGVPSRPPTKGPGVMLRGIMPEGLFGGVPSRPPTKGPGVMLRGIMPGGGIFAVFLGILVGMPASYGHADGFSPARARISLFLGSENSDYAIHPKTITLENDRPYRLSIISRGFKPYPILAPEFFAAIELDEIKTDGVEIEAEEISSITLEEEFEEVRTDILFTPRKKGNYAIIIRGYETKGMRATINVR